MFTLTIIRHAKSSWNDPSVSDFNRTLNKRGESDAPMMASRLKNRHYKSDKIISSPATRATNTAEIFCSKLGISDKQIEFIPQIYEANLESLYYIISGLPDNMLQVMIFGHNPGLEYLANYIQPNSVNRMPTCAIAQYQLDMDHWSNLDSGCGELIFFDYPKSNAAE